MNGDEGAVERDGSDVDGDGGAVDGYDGDVDWDGGDVDGVNDKGEKYSKLNGFHLFYRDLAVRILIWFEYLVKEPSNRIHQGNCEFHYNCSSLLPFP